jgi:hypothetical protein
MHGYYIITEALLNFSVKKFAFQAAIVLYHEYAGAFAKIPAEMTVLRGILHAGPGMAVHTLRGGLFLRRPARRRRQALRRGLEAVCNAFSDHPHPADAGRESVSEEQLRALMDISEEKGAMEADEKEMIENVFDSTTLWPRM